MADEWLLNGLEWKGAINIEFHLHESCMVFSVLFPSENQITLCINIMNL